MQKIIIAFFIFFSCNSSKDTESNKEQHSKIVEVLTKKDAITIAQSNWLKLYGRSIYTNQPFVAKLKGDTIWIVEGTLHNGVGGVPYIEIRKSDGYILKIYHSR